MKKLVTKRMKKNKNIKKTKKIFVFFAFLGGLRDNALDLPEKLLTKLQGFTSFSVRKWFETGNASPSAP
jgi:hypothetical protein